jgi:hypothetical protein
MPYILRYPPVPGPAFTAEQVATTFEVMAGKILLEAAARERTRSS